MPKTKNTRKCGGTPEGEEHFHFIDLKSTFRILGENPRYKSSNHWVISVAQTGIFGSPQTPQQKPGTFWGLARFLGCQTLGLTHWTQRLTHLPRNNKPLRRTKDEHSLQTAKVVSSKKRKKAGETAANYTNKVLWIYFLTFR